MFDTDALRSLQRAIRDRTVSDKKLLDELRDEVRPLSGSVRTIKRRTTTSVSLVASDGGNNKLQFDPFYIQLVRVVDSYGKQLCFDSVSPTTDTDVLSKSQFDIDGTPRTALGRLMRDLGLDSLHVLSPMIPSSFKMRETPHEISPGWVLVYRDLCEWAVLYERICYHTFATDTLIVRDGLLRSKLFRGEYFIDMRRRIEEAISRIQKNERRKVILVGSAKHSTVLTKYQLALAIENTMPAGEARYVRVPRNIEAKAYIWPEWGRGDESEGSGKEAPKFVGGDMYLVRFGPRSGDPVWAVDLFTPQVTFDAEIFGYLLSDSVEGFPVPFYPHCLQKAHEYAQIVDFDLVILQDEIFKSVRDLLPHDKKHVVDGFQFLVDASARRYE